MMDSPRRRRVAITGFGVVSAAGTGIEPLWRAIVERRSLLTRVSRFDTSTYACSVGGEVDDAVFDELVHPKKRRSSTRVTRIALAAAQLALHDSRFPDELYAAERRGVFAGTALGGWFEGGQQAVLLAERGVRRVNPFLANGAPHHTPGAEVASSIGFQGPQLTFANGCPAGVAAIAQGAAMIASGEIDACIAGGAECPITPLVYAGMGRTGELASGDVAPELASRPFDNGRLGMVLSEGACFVILEEAEHARERGASLRAEVLASAASCDAAGLYAVDPTSRLAAATIGQALGRAGIAASAIDYVCSHANAGAAFDRKETQALRLAFAESIDALPVSSIKGVLGHPFAAAGAFQVAAATLAMEKGLVPPTANLDDPDPACSLRHVTGAALKHAVRYALVTSYGYGGLNACMVLGHADGLLQP